MEEVGSQVTPPLFIHQTLSSQFCDGASLAKKRDLSYLTPPYQFLHHSSPQQRFLHTPNYNWSPKSWEWDTSRFLAKPVGNSDSNFPNLSSQHNNLKIDNSPPHHHFVPSKNNVPAAVTAVDVDDDDSLRLNLAGALNSNSVEEPVSRPNKRVRSGSPGSASYPMCQVDNCKEDLSNAKDYHRRHKVCELHSKSTKALVAKQMQRFCQQCSRFHPLSEFDEGKRSCRRRLAGHNRRRRKTQPDDVTSRLLLPGNRETNNNANLDIVNLLTAWACNQGKNEDKGINCSSVPDRDQLVQILSKINSLPLPMDVAAKLSYIGSLNKNSEKSALDPQSKSLGISSTSSTMDFLGVLSATLAASAPEALAMLCQRSSQSSDSEKSRLTSSYKTQMRHPPEFSSTVAERNSSCYRPSLEDSDCQIQETHPSLPLQLFSSSPEEISPPKLASSRKYFSSDSSNPLEDRSPSSSPVVQKLFPLQSSAELLKSEKMTVNREVNVNIANSRIRGSMLPLELFTSSNKVEQNSRRSSPHQGGYTSSSGSDHSPSSQNSEDRTERIIFKLFGKDPSHFPGTLRQQIYNWLSNGPSEMESYIRPGCVVLSLYLSMSSVSWNHFERNLLQHVASLLQHSDTDFWRNGRFILHTGRQLVSHKDGKLRLCKSWRTWSSPELISVSPVAVVGGQETSIVLRGRNLSNTGTKIHWTYMGGYATKDVTGSACKGTLYDEISVDGLRIDGASSNFFGRFFIEVENGFKGNSFPVIIADSTICKELRLLEAEFEDETKLGDVITEEQGHDLAQPRSRDEVLHFLNELGWLFQRRRQSSELEVSVYSLDRFKFVLMFSVERDYCMLVKKILDMLVEGNMDRDGLSKESLAMLSDIQLLSRAVKRRCRKMLDMLIHYTIDGVNNSSNKYIFLPNIMGPAGISPLHLAACTPNVDDLIDALTNDPLEIGLSCWNSMMDANGQTPHGYAKMTHNDSYNALVASKLVDRKNGQVSVAIEDDIAKDHVKNSHLLPTRKSCAKCATVAAKYNRRMLGPQGLLQRPYIHSMLAIAAVCVCVCLFFRGAPDIGLVEPFKWEKLDFGTI